MKHEKKGFTVVEVIIVIAVIAILAAILILALPKAIDESKEKSALSDAVNTFRQAISDADDLNDLECSYIIVVEKYEKEYIFGCSLGDDAPESCEGNPFEKSAHKELADALCELGLIDAPLGLTEATVPEQFENVSLYSGGKLQPIQARLDVEVSKSMDLPSHGTLDVSWHVENPLLAQVSDGKINGKQVGKTILTAKCGNLRIAYSLYIGKRVEAESFEDVKRACEDSSPSVFIYPKYNADMAYLALDPTKEQLPVTIPNYKQVSFCAEQMLQNDEDENTPYYQMQITYRYCNFDVEEYNNNHIAFENYVGEPVEAIFINEGGILTFDHTMVYLQNYSSYEEAGFMTDTGSCIINRNGGSVTVQNGAEIYADGLPIPYNYIFGIPVSDSDDDYTKAVTNAIVAASGQRTDYAIENENGELLSDNGYLSYVYNGRDGVLKVSNNEKELNLFDRLYNEGTVYKLDNLRLSAIGFYDYKFINIINTGTIYEISNVDWKICRGGCAAVSSGYIGKISGCKFTLFPQLSPDVLTGESGHLNYNLSRQQAEEYLAKKAYAFKITGGKIGDISDCEFNCDGIVFEGCEPFPCVISGKFRDEPDDAVLKGDDCVFDAESGMYLVY